MSDLHRIDSVEKKIDTESPKIYQVTRIEEMDYGCEGLPDGEQLMVSVFIQDEAGNDTILRVKDDTLYERDINEGDRVILQGQELWK